jgi:VWFA-related protein
MPPVQTVPPGTVPQGDSAASPKNQVNPNEPLYKLRVTTSFVQVPVLVRDSENRLVYGLTWKDFTVNENGKPQTLTYFTSDPFPLSVAIVLDIGMPDVTLQKINETYGSLVGAFSPYDEMSLYTYSSTVSQVSDFSSRTEKLTAALDEMKLVRGGSNGPPVLGGPLGPQPPMANGIPIGTSGPPPVMTPAKQAIVLNDAILRAALDLSKRPREMRKVIFVISDGREYGSRSSYGDVLRLLQTRDIQVQAVVVDQGALPLYKQIGRLRLKGQGYSNIMPRYVYATGGGQVYSELSRNAIEDAYASMTSQARNQYTLGYNPKPIADASAYRSIEVIVHKKGLKVSARDGYYRIPPPPLGGQR